MAKSQLDPCEMQRHPWQRRNQHRPWTSKFGLSQMPQRLGIRFQPLGGNTTVNFGQMTGVQSSVARWISLIPLWPLHLLAVSPVIWCHLWCVICPKASPVSKWLERERWWMEDNSSHSACQKEGQGWVVDLAIVRMGLHSDLQGAACLRAVLSWLTWQWASVSKR